MLGTANLSLEQAPPLSIPFRFFLTAPLFGVVAGLLVLFYGSEVITSRWLPATLGLTHVITLGFLTMVMCGAMMQMLPVLTGSPLPRVRFVGASLHIGLVVGTSALVLSFLTGFHALTWMAMFFLGVGLGIFLVALFVALIRVKVTSATITGMRLAGFALFLTIALGLLLLVARSGWLEFSQPRLWVDAHLAWGLVGWVGLLLVSVSYQVVPMFHVTPEYPGWMRGALGKILFILLLAWSVGWLMLSPQMVSEFILALLLLVLLTFVVTTFRLFLKKKRKVRDVTLWFWRASLTGVLGAVIIWFSLEFVPPTWDASIWGLMIGALALFAAMAVINAMLYKIAPFLSWFHLQHRQLALGCFSVSVPHMKTFLSDRAVISQFYLWLSGVVCFLLALLLHRQMVYPGAILIAASNLYLFWNLVSIVRLYNKVNRQLTAEAARLVRD